MATRQSIDALIQQCEDALRFASEQYQGKQPPRTI